MRKLNENYWRSVWVSLTNGVVILLFLSAPIRSHHEQELIYQAMRTAPPTFSYFREFFSDPWRPTIVAILALGIVTEFFRSILSPIINLAIYLVWPIMFLWEEAKVVRGTAPSEVSPGLIVLLFIIPLVAVIAVNLGFYAHAFRQANTQKVVSGLGFGQVTVQGDILGWRMNPIAAKIVAVIVGGVAAITLDHYFERWWSVSVRSGNLEFYHACLTFGILFGVTFACCKWLSRFLSRSKN